MPKPEPRATSPSTITRPDLAALRARLATYGVLVVLVGASLLHVEAWPISAYQLFSHVRTGELTTLDVVALDADGEEHRVVLGAASHRVGNPAHQLSVAWRSSPPEQARRMRTWLELAGLDPDDYVGVRVDEVRWRLDDDGRRAEELRRTTVLEVDL